MTDGLVDFQSQFVQALFSGADDAPSEIAQLVSQPGFAVYRNTVIKGRIDALQANYPAVARLVGEEWFRTAAAIYARMDGASDRSMLSYGESFPAFLEQFEPAKALGYLPEVAQLDRFWTEAHASRDEPVLDPAAIAGLTPAALGGVVLHLHATARWAWFDAVPVYSIWQRNREKLECDSEIAWRGEGTLVTRPSGVVKWIELDASGCAFLDACRAGRPLAEAARAAVEVQGDTDLARLLAALLIAGAFSRTSFAAE